ncbi:3'-5' exonuclease [Entomophthora muscae]|uniref:3'-5' exonuclease n=1 Tax=Entomophthora muscae TaxID=34485 RepID=A0ACC2S4F7_9FUNG|nr:3'-5' exonuclease [Entomophthora muscae]
MKWARKKKQVLEHFDERSLNKQLLSYGDLDPVISSSDKPEQVIPNANSVQKPRKPVFHKFQKKDNTENTSKRKDRYKNKRKAKEPNKIKFEDTHWFAISKAKKALKFKVDEFLVESRKILSELPKSRNYISSLEELFPENLAGAPETPEEQLQLILSENMSQGLLSPPARTIALDCEMVGSGPKGSINKLGRVSLVDYYGNVIYDTFVFQKDVTDYRTWISGIEAKDLKNAPSFSDVQQKVKEYLQGHTVVGHSLKVDFEVLEIAIEDYLTFDIAKAFSNFNVIQKSAFGLKSLTFNLLGIKIQTASHSSLTDALATVAIYRLLLPVEENTDLFSEQVVALQNQAALCSNPVRPASSNLAKPKKQRIRVKRERKQPNQDTDSAK